MPVSSKQWTVGGVAFAVYLAYVRSRRFANVRYIEKKYAHLLADPSKMTYPEATEIQRFSGLYESPMLAKLALEFALFQTCKPGLLLSNPRADEVPTADAIPTISSLLHHTQQLTCPSLYGKRAEDTGVLLLEAQVHGLDSERGSQAVARTNWQHARYGSKISRDDKLFTLSLFMFEPLRLIDEHDWRKTTALEKQARFVFWRELGARMGIDDIPKTSEELQEWCEEFMQKNMVYAESNAIVGDATIQLFLRPYPAFMRPFIRQVLLVLVPQRVREAFGWGPSRPAFLYVLVPAILSLRAFVIRYLLLPRSRSNPGDFGISNPKNVTVDAKGEPRYLRTNWFFEPLYCRPTWRGRLWALLGHDTPGPKWRPDGYSLCSVGPSVYEQKGVEEVKTNAEKMRTTANGGACPFAPR